MSTRNKEAFQGKRSCRSFKLVADQTNTFNNRIKPKDNPLNLGKYEQVRAKHLEENNRKLAEQIASDSQRKAVDKTEERELDKLRTDCVELQHAKEKIEEREKRKQNTESERKEYDEVVALNEQRKERMTMLKHLEHEHMLESERKYKEHKKVWNTT